MINLLKKNWLIIVILVIAAFFRLYRIQDYMEFLGDQGRDVFIVRDFLKNGNLFFIGPQTSIGNMYLGPFYYYLFVAPGLLLSAFSPVGPAIVVALLGILTVYLVFKLGSRWFNPKVGYLAAFLYAVSPVVIKYSSFSWNPNIMPLFALLFIYFLTKSKTILATLTFVIALNSHYLALLLLPVGLIVWLFNRTSWKPIFISIAVFFLSLVPQILFDIKHHGQNINAIITFFSQRETTVNLKAYKAIPGILPLFNQINTSLLSGKNINFGYIVSVVFALLLIYVIYRQFKAKKYNRYFIFIFIWYLIGLVGLALYKQHVYDHYFGFLFPAVFLLFAYLLSYLPKYLLIMVMVVLTVFSLLENPFRWTAPRQLATTQAIDDSIVVASGGQPFNFALLAKMGWGFTYFLTEDKNYFDLKDKMTDQLFVVCVPFQINCNPINNPEWGVAAFGWAKIDTQWDINGIKVFRLVHNLSGK